MESSELGEVPGSVNTPNREEMLAKTRAKMNARRKTAGGVRASDTRPRSARKTTKKITIGALSEPPPTDMPVLPVKEEAPASVKAEVKDTSNKFAQEMASLGLADSHTPSGGQTRFQDSVVTPYAGPAETRKTATPKKTPRAGAQDPLFFDDLEEFVSNPAPKGVVVQCRITRDKSGIGKGPTYFLKLERQEPNGVKQVFLLAGRKRKKSSTSNYLISTSATDLSRDGESFIAKLRSNFVGTHFTTYDNGHNPSKPAPTAGSEIRKELAAVVYDSNLLGFKGPRKMTVIIPRVDDNDQRIDVQPVQEHETILKRFENNDRAEEDMLILRNKQPTWNEETNSYVLNFYGRVKVASVKNFQVVHDSDPNYIIMQFGRVEDDAFSMDFQYPMSAVQAFSIALTSFDNKLMCE